MFPTQAIRSHTQRKILRVLSEKNRMYTTGELAEMCQRSEASISRALKNVERYSFIKSQNVEGSKKRSYGLNPEYEYSKHIKDFFGTEKRKERKNGTVPVKIWNLLEDISIKLESEIEDLQEVFLFGSYSTGEYYAGSDIDLVVLRELGEGEASVSEVLNGLKTDKEIHAVEIREDVPQDASKEEVREILHKKSPAQDLDSMIALLGEVEL